MEHCCHRVVFWFGYRCVFVSGYRCVVFVSGYRGVVFDVWKTVQPQGGVLVWLQVCDIFSGYRYVVFVSGYRYVVFVSGYRFVVFVSGYRCVAFLSSHRLFTGQCVENCSVTGWWLQVCGV